MGDAVDFLAMWKSVAMIDNIPMFPRDRVTCVLGLVGCNASRLLAWPKPGLGGEITHATCEHSQVQRSGAELNPQKALPL